MHAHAMHLEQCGLAVLELATLVVGPGQVHHHLHVVVLEELLQGILVLKPQDPYNNFA